MKALLLAAFALTIAAPALAEEDAAAAMPATATTYEQAFTECTDTTKDAQGDKAEALKACMTEKGFELKDEQTSALTIDGLQFAEVTATTKTETTTETEPQVLPAVTDATTTTTTTVETPEADAAVSTETVVEGEGAAVSTEVHAH